MGDDHSFEAILSASERVGFRIDEVLRKDAELDFSKPFLPEALSCTESIGGLSPKERLLFNHVRGHTYLCLFAVVEEFILPFVLDHARADLGQDSLRTRALLTFAGEEAKHIQLFQRFRACFERGFGVRCEMVGPAEQVATAVLGHGPLGVAWTILHIEWMTQRHYVESVKDRGHLEPQFTSLLKHHWLEEAQHAKLDTWMVESLASQLSPREVASSVEEYLQILAELADLLDAQLELELASFERARARPLDTAERAELRSVQRRALRSTFIGSGMTHPSLCRTLEELSPVGAARVRAVAPQYC